MTDRPAVREYSDAELERLIEQQWQAARPAPSLPGWVPATMRLLPWTLLAATLINGLIGVVAILTPLLAAGFGSAVSDPLYTVYSYICPQRPSHTFFIAGHPMAFEQRDLSMHLGFALAGLLYVRVAFLRRPMPTWLMVAAVAPLLVDVAISTVELLPATGFSRTWTGALAAVAIVWWAYPRFDRMLEQVRTHVERVRARSLTAQPEADRFVLAEGGGTEPANERT